MTWADVGSAREGRRLTWDEALWWANICARHTQQRFRVYRRRLRSGRRYWDFEPIGGWLVSTRETGKESA